MPTSLKSPIDALLPSGKRTFLTFEEVRDWSRSELVVWREFAKKTASISRYVSVNGLPGAFEGPASWSEAAIGGTEPGQNETHIRNHFDRRARSMLLSTSARGRHVLSLADSDPLLAANLAGVWDVTTIDINSLFRGGDEIEAREQRVAWFLAVAHAAAFDAGLTEAGTRQRSSALDDLSRTMHLANDQASRRNERLGAETREIISAIESTRADQIAAAKAQLDALEEKIKEQLSNANKQIEEFRNETLKTLSLQEPASYWSAKAEAHETRGDTISHRFNWMIGILGVGWVAAFVLVGAWPALRESVFDNQFSLRPLILFGIPAIFAIWILRLRSRRLLTERALAEDASERAVIARTLLALNEKGLLEPTEKVLILQALTRPSPQSAVDDAAPATLADTVFKEVAARRSK